MRVAPIRGMRTDRLSALSALTLVFASALLGACSSSPTDESEQGAALTVGAGNDERTAPAPTVTAGLPTPTPPKTPPSSSPGQTGDQRLYPLAPGRQWTYSARPIAGATTASSSCTGTQLTYVVGDGAQYGGVPSVRFQSLCSVVVDLVQDGDRVYAYVPDSYDEPSVALDAPVEEGHAWEVRAGIQAVWENAGTVQVPAGTFQDCWRRRDVEGDMVVSPGYVTYCRGIGMVQLVNPDDGYEAELASKNF
jgi:hypothetical protein